MVLQVISAILLHSCSAIPGTDPAYHQVNSTPVRGYLAPPICYALATQSPVLTYARSATRRSAKAIADMVQDSPFKLKLLVASAGHVPACLRYLPTLSAYAAATACPASTYKSVLVKWYLPTSLLRKILLRTWRILLAAYATATECPVLSAEHSGIVLAARGGAVREGARGQDQGGNPMQVLSAYARAMKGGVSGAERGGRLGAMRMTALKWLDQEPTSTA
eukprot:2137949-Rhodomonas_salina.1